jgi:hypothetical protein
MAERRKQSTGEFAARTDTAVAAVMPKGRNFH